MANKNTKADVTDVPGLKIGDSGYYAARFFQVAKKQGDVDQFGVELNGLKKGNSMVLEFCLF